ncbi:PIN domain-containing protein [Pararcticibacter amylolyticus]|uniref:PIN domain-containing protein n=1 Tax=Pararcticibacter amylolyticus TaxID=2173175 RepID=UPI0026D0485A
MSLIICDTNIFISMLRGVPDTIEELKTIGNSNVLIPSVSVMELYRGMHNNGYFSECRYQVCLRTFLVPNRTIGNFPSALNSTEDPFVYAVNLSIRSRHTVCRLKKYWMNFTSGVINYATWNREQNLRILLSKLPLNLKFLKKLL